MTLALFARPRRAAADTPPPKPAPPADALFEKLDKLDAFPLLSDTATRAMSLVNDPDATLADLAAVVKRDGVLAAAVLRQANRTGYGRGGDITDVGQAVMRLGLRGCGGVVAAAGVKGLYSKLPDRVRVPAENVLRHSLFVGGLAAGVAKLLRLGLGGEEYTAGLLHDIGRVVMCVNSPGRYAAVCSAEYDAAPDGRKMEREVFGTDHCAVGALFCVKNNLPTRIGRAVMRHHDPDAEEQHRPLAGVVALADELANHLHLHRTLGTFRLDDSGGYRVLRRLVVRERAAEFCGGLPRLVAGCVRDTRGLLKTLGG